MSETAEQLQEEVQEAAPEKQEIDVEAKLAERDAKLAEQAKSKGWMSFEEHVAAGNDPEEWRDARGFLDYGDMRARIQKFQHGYEKKAQDDHKYFKALFDIRRKELEDKFEQAVDDGDPEQIRKAKKQLDAHEDTEEQAVAQPQAPAVDPVVQAWNQKNSWVANPNDARAPFTHVQWKMIVESGQFKDAESAIAELERRIAREFPAQQKSRGHVPGSESGKGSQGFKGKQRSLTWSDLTEEEEKVFKTGLYGDDKERFLKKTQSIREVIAKAGE